MVDDVRADDGGQGGPGEGRPGGWARPPSEDAVWTYRGYQMRAGEFTTAMVHFFRAEISRSNTWRQRLDATTNWAVIATGAAISFAFTSRGASGVDHGVIILNTLLVTVFLLIEARRYRYYELWSYRVRLMETDFYAAMLVPPFQPSPDWAETLAESLLHPQFPISRREAFGRRFRRNYVHIYALLCFAWFLKVWLHPKAATSMDEFLGRAAVGSVPGWVVILIGAAFNVAVLAFGWLTVGLQDAAGEVLPRYGDMESALKGKLGRGEARSRAGAWFRPRARQRSQLVTFIITTRPEDVAGQVIEQLGRGVTALQGKGMYTGGERSVLLCALTVTEVPQLRSIVEAVDPDAFVIVSPVHQVLGEGFVPLHDEPSEPAPRGR